MAGGERRPPQSSSANTGAVRRTYLCRTFFVLAALATATLVSSYTYVRLDGWLPAMGAPEHPLRGWVPALRRHLSMVNNATNLDDDDSDLIVPANKFAASDECNNTRISLDMEGLAFLDGYKSPCWMDSRDVPVTDLYRNNTYPEFSWRFSPPTVKELAKWRAYFRARSGGRGEGAKVRRVRCLPYFYVLGAMKSGTTDLYRKLTMHPDVMVTRKEPMWWTRGRFGYDVKSGRPISFESYVDLFDMAADQVKVAPSRRVIGDYGPTTIWEQKLSFGGCDALNKYCPGEVTGERDALRPPTCELRAVSPTARLLAIVREPGARQYSEYLFTTPPSEPRGPALFHRHVEAAIRVFRACLARADGDPRPCVYPDRHDFNIYTRQLRLWFNQGFYAAFLRDWLRVFPRDQLLVIRTEDLARDPARTMARVYSFLGLSPMPPSYWITLGHMDHQNRRRPEDRKLGPMLNETRALLTEFFRPYNEDLARLLGSKAFLWEDASHNDATGQRTQKLSLAQAAMGLKGGLRKGMG